MSSKPRIVITGLGLTAPNGNSLGEFRANLLAGKARIAVIDVRHMGKHPAGVCDFDATKWQKRKEIRNGTRVGSISIFCAREALGDAGLDWDKVDKSRVGVYLGITEHGNVETENEIHNISQFGNDTKYWTHHHNPRTVANNPAGEVTMNMGITGPHYTIGAACAAGNAGLIQAAQMLQLGEVDIAFAGGVSESIHTFGIFAGFKNQGALAPTRTRPRPRARSTRTATASSSPKAGPSTSSNDLTTPSPAAPGSSPRSPAGASTPTPPTPSCPTPSARPSASAWPCSAPA